MKPDKIYQKPGCTIRMFNADCMEYLGAVPDKSVTTILTDPPYKYLKNQKLETDFDEAVLLDHLKRICTDDALVALFGRGTSFYRWNTMLANLGFNFKEEIVWNKRYTTSPVLPINRVHETISIHTLKTGIINKIKLPYKDVRSDFDIDKVVNDVNRLKTALNNPPALKQLIEYFQNGKRLDYANKKTAIKHKATMGTDRVGTQLFTCAQSIRNGMSPFSIVEVQRDHYSTIHPTQKPVKLMNMLLRLMSANRVKKVIDPFGGSMPVAIACWDMGFDLDIIELDKEYFYAAVKRFEQHISQLQIDF